MVRFRICVSLFILLLPLDKSQLIISLYIYINDNFKKYYFKTGKRVISANCLHILYFSSNCIFRLLLQLFENFMVLLKSGSKYLLTPLLICYCIFASPARFHLFLCVSACIPFCLCLGWTNRGSQSVQHNSLRGQRLKLSSLGGSSTHATLDRTGSPVRLESELSSPQEVVEPLNRGKSKGRELEKENTESSGGQDEENDQRDEKDLERSKGSLEIEKEDEIATALVKEECCGGDDEQKFKGCEESENMSGRGKIDSSKNEGEHFVEKKNEETSEQSAGEEEVVEIDAVKDCSNCNEDVERRSFSEGELRPCDKEGIARYLKSKGGETEGNGSEIDESAALQTQTAPEGEGLSESGTTGVHPADVDEKSDLKKLEQKSESLPGSLVAEVWFRAVSLCDHI